MKFKSNFLMHQQKDITKYKYLQQNGKGRAGSASLLQTGGCLTHGHQANPFRPLTKHKPKAKHSLFSAPGRTFYVYINAKCK